MSVISGDLPDSLKLGEEDEFEVGRQIPMGGQHGLEEGEDDLGPECLSQVCGPAHDYFEGKAALLPQHLQVLPHGVGVWAQAGQRGECGDEGRPHCLVGVAHAPLVGLEQQLLRRRRR
jgi:hypothetical protein